ncbi:MAG TPA: AMP-binding protein, partial [Stellaceae bacterium]|nr:AMP-binding protein [Stellaceae bacterium]
MANAVGNAYDYFIDRHLREGRGERLAFADPWRSLTYAELAAASARFAAGLCAAGIERERRIALVMLDTVDFPVAFWGAVRAGVVPVPINTLLPADITGYILEDSRAAALVVSAPLLAPLRPALDRLGLGRVVVSTPDGKGGDFDAFLGSTGSNAPPADCSPDEVAFWLYSSGSTGAPKGVRHVHSSLKATADTYGIPVLGIAADDLMFSVAKLFFAYGLGNSMTFPMAAGAAAVLYPDRPTPEAVLATMRKYRPTIFAGVPTLYAALVADPALGP